MEIASTTVSFGFIFGVFVIVFMMFIVLGLIFGLGVAVGRAWENPARGVLGVKKGNSAVGVDSGDSIGEATLDEFLEQQFGGKNGGQSWRSEKIKAARAGKKYDEALQDIDKQTQRFLDNMVAGRGPVIGRSGGGDDDD